MKEQKFDLEMHNISKNFPGVKALDNVNFCANCGKSVAIVGANGAGKSTLMKVLTGFYDNYEGEIFINNEKKEMYNPIISKNSGVMCIYQEVDISLMPYLSVAENIFIDEFAMSKGKNLINWTEVNQRAKAIFDDMGIEIDVKKMVSELTLSEKQMVLIARAKSMDIQFLILDEPTAPLSLNEIEKLFKIIKDLKEKQVGIIYISHRLNEVLEISDEIVVMKNGQISANLITGETNRNTIIQKMVGESFLKEFPKEDVEIGEEVLRVEDVFFEKKVKNVSFSLHKGEILGIVGLVGAGKTELSKVIFGAEKMDAGNIYVGGKKISTKTPTHAVENKIALVPEERRKEGIMVDEEIVHNLSISSLQSFVQGLFVDRKKEKKVAEEIVKDLAIKTPSVNQYVKNLSGGNQQKVVVGKWLVNDADIYLMDEPTKGVDIGSKTEIFKLIGSLVKKSKSVIYLSNEIEEIEGIADRVLVMYDGEIIKELTRKEITLETMLYYSTGGKDNVNQ